MAKQLQDGQRWTSLLTGQVREVITSECYSDGEPSWRDPYRPQRFMQYREVLPRKGRVRTILRKTFHDWVRRYAAVAAAAPGMGLYDSNGGEKFATLVGPIVISEGSNE